jgi:hypothetical protein
MAQVAGGALLSLSRLNIVQRGLRTGALEVDPECLSLKHWLQQCMSLICFRFDVDSAHHNVTPTTLDIGRKCIRKIGRAPDRERSESLQILLSAQYPTESMLNWTCWRKDIFFNIIRDAESTLELQSGRSDADCRILPLYLPSLSPKLRLYLSTRKALALCFWRQVMVPTIGLEVLDQRLIPSTMMQLL